MTRIIDAVISICIKLNIYPAFIRKLMLQRISELQRSIIRNKWKTVEAEQKLDWVKSLQINDESLDF